MLLTADGILAAQDTDAPVKVKIPEWGGDAYLRVMGGAERDQWELIAEAGIKKKTHANIRASLLVATLCDKDGKRLFGNGQSDALGKKSSIVIDRLFDVAQKLNKLKESDIDELEKN